MKVYLAARYDRRAEVHAYAQRLAVWGIQVMSTWHDGHHEVRPDVERDATDAEMRSWAKEDLADLWLADTLLFFAEPPQSGSTRGGRHVEYGVALALRHRIVVIGPKENVFHVLPGIEHFPDFESFARTPSFVPQSPLR